MAPISLGVVAVVNLLVGCAWSVLMCMAIRASFRLPQYDGRYSIATVIVAALAAACFWSAWGLLYAKRRAWITSQVIGIFLLTLSLAWVVTILNHPYVDFGPSAVTMMVGTGAALLYLVLLNLPSVRRIFRQTRSSGE
jgi:hypothetical protein